MAKVGGGYLGKLESADLAKPKHVRGNIWRHELTKRGRRLLSEHEGGSVDPGDWDEIWPPHKALEKSGNARRGRFERD